MLLALSATAIVVVALLWEVAMPKLSTALDRHRARRARVAEPGQGYDPGRERRAEQRARSLLRSCVNEEEWAMYRDLGFIRVWGRLSRGPERGGSAHTEAGAPYATSSIRTSRSWRSCPRRGRCSANTASSSRTRRVRTEARGFPIPTTSSPSGWR